jgi:hypothetical protein
LAIWRWRLRRSIASATGHGVGLGSPGLSCELPDRSRAAATIAVSIPFSMHALSLPTWWIHITSVLEWLLAILVVQAYGRQRREPGWRWLALAMVPALISAMAACTWHLFDNSSQLHGLVVLQAGLTFVGNATLAGAAGLLLRQQRARGDSNDVVANP